LCYSLQNAGVAFDFAGSLQSGAGFSDIDHEGHPGILADQLDAPTIFRMVRTPRQRITTSNGPPMIFTMPMPPALTLFFFLRSVFNKILQENQALRHNIFPQSSWRAAINVTLIKLINAKG
jgi:hypothetical protein